MVKGLAQPGEQKALLSPQTSLEILVLLSP